MTGSVEEVSHGNLRTIAYNAPRVHPVDLATLSAGMPPAIAEQLARSLAAVEAARAAGRELPERILAPSRAALLLRVIQFGGRVDARALALHYGCGGGSGDLDRAIGWTMLAYPGRLREALELGQRTG